MKYVKARFTKNGVPFGKAYTYSTELDVNPGDVVRTQTATLIIVDEPVDEEELKIYGTSGIKEITRKQEREEGEQHD